MAVRMVCRLHTIGFWFGVRVYRIQGLAFWHTNLQHKVKHLLPGVRAITGEGGTQGDLNILNCRLQCLPRSLSLPGIVCLLLAVQGTYLFG